MLLSIGKIKLKPGLTQDYHVSGCIPPSVTADYTGFSLKDPVIFDGKVTNSGNGTFQVEGNYQGKISYVCSRCLAPCVRSVSGRLNALFSEDPLTVQEDEVDIRRLDGDNICLDGLIMSSISFDMPMQPLCREDCRGLCPICGADLNKKACTCREDQIDPRWEKLKNFKFTPDK